mgnify:CR=1 FL=1
MAHQASTFAELECTLTADLARITEYCSRWRLKPSVTKTVSSVFHLHNASASRELEVTMNGQRLRHDPFPCYLGVTFDRALTYKEHLTKTAKKLASRKKPSNETRRLHMGCQCKHPAHISNGPLLLSC